MAAQVMIEFVPDVSKVKSALETIQESGAATESVDAFKAGNAEIEKRNKLLATQAALSDKNEQSETKQLATIKQVATATDKLASSVIKISASEFQKMMTDTGKSAQQTINALAGVTQETEELTDAQEQNKTSSQSLRAEKRALSQQIAELIDRGEQESAMFQELVNRAGEIDDAMADANDAIRRTGSDTRGLDNALLAMRGIAAGFTVATSAMALFGDESEDVQKILLKVNAAMALLNGLQEIQNLLKSEYIKTLIASITAERAHNANLILENALTSESVVVRTLATAAQWALNAAMAANPIGLVVTALAALVIGLKYFIDNSEEATIAQMKFNDALDASQVESDLRAVNRFVNERVAALEKAGAKQSVIEQVRLSGMREEIRLTDELLAKSEQAVILAGDDDKKRAEAIKTRNDLQTKGLDLQSQIRVEEINHQKTLREEQTKTAEDRIALGNVALANSKKNSKEEMNARIQIIEATREVELRDLQLTAAKRAEIYATSNREIADLRKDFADREKQRAADDAIAVAQTAVVLQKKGSQQELDARIILVEEMARKELLNKELTVNQKREIEARAMIEVSNLQKEFDEQEKQRRIKNAEEIAEMEALIRSGKIGALQRAAQDITATESERFRAGQATREAELQDIQLKQGEIYKTYINGLSTYKQFQKDLTKSQQDEDQKRFEIEQASAARRKEIIKAVAAAALASAQIVSDTIFAMNKERRDADLQEQLDALEKQRDAAVSTKNLTEQQKSDIQKFYDRQLAQLKTEAAKKERKAQTDQALVNTFLAITNALATAPWPYNVIAAAAAGVAGFAQVLKIQNTPLPQYKKGGRNIPAGMALVGEEGPELVEFKGGENIYDAKKSDRMINGWKVAENDRRDVYRQKEKIGEYIDYEEIGRQVARHMPEITTVNMVADENGLSIFLQRQQSRIAIRNRRYST
jgi:hypothetical protein